MLERIQEDIETYVVLLFVFSNPDELSIEEVQKQISFFLPESVSAPVRGVKNISFSFESDLNDDHPPFLVLREKYERPPLSKWDFWTEYTGSSIVVRDSGRVASNNDFVYVCGVTAFLTFEVDYEWDWDEKADEYQEEVKSPLLSSLVVDFGTLSEVGVYAGFSDM